MAPSDFNKSSFSNSFEEPVPKLTPHWRDRLAAIDQWWAILVLLFGVMGVLGIPILFLSRSYSLPMKLLLAVLVTIYTAFLFWFVYFVWTFVFAQLNA